MKYLFTILCIFSLAYGQYKMPAAATIKAPYKMPVMVRDGAGNLKPALVGWKYSAQKSQIWKVTVFVVPHSKGIPGYARFVMIEEVLESKYHWTPHIAWKWDKVMVTDAAMNPIKLGDGGYIRYTNPIEKTVDQERL
jgi:hypothetical protein